MAAPLDALQTKLGPAPAWVWLAGGGLVLYLAPKLGLFGQRASTIPARTPSPAAQAPGAPPTPPAAPHGLTPGATGVTVWDGQVYHYAVTAPGQGPNEALRAWGLAPSSDLLGRLTYFSPNPYHDAAGNTVWYMGLLDDQGRPLPTPATWPPPYAGPLPALGGRAIGGGARSSIGRSPGRRSEAPWHWHGHPLLKQQAHYPHYVATGGGGASVHAVAHAAGLHPARLMAVNPHLHGPGRGGPDDPGTGGFTDAMAQPSYTPPRTSRGPAAGIAPQDIGLQYMRTPGAPLPASGGPRLPPHRMARAGQLIRVR